ncbi:hypothetical protein HDA40_002123 [Hamadaea flava]|uniref:Uncharacterized protein n=1 Tax=Hamadaea flava TaxID=1742688 RepID=A0ABV8LLI4_9ACTN|nr:hypothetical protein [Hamadaea flava]MCP2323616.1 hypothetical protein [Hamadaea flava]
MGQIRKRYAARLGFGLPAAAAFLRHNPRSRRSRQRAGAAR